MRGPTTAAMRAVPHQGARLEGARRHLHPLAVEGTGRQHVLGDAGQPLAGVVVAAGAGQEQGDGRGPRPSEGEGLEGGLDLGHRLVRLPIPTPSSSAGRGRPGSPWCRPPARPGPGRRAWPTGRRRSGPRAWPAWPSRRPRPGGRGGRRWRWPGRRRRRCPRPPGTGGPSPGGRRCATSSPRWPGPRRRSPRRCRRSGRSPSAARRGPPVPTAGCGGPGGRPGGPWCGGWRGWGRRPPTGRRSSPWRRARASGSAHSSLQVVGRDVASGAAVAGSGDRGRRGCRRRVGLPGRDSSAVAGADGAGLGRAWRLGAVSGEAGVGRLGLAGRRPVGLGGGGLGAALRRPRFGPWRPGLGLAAGALAGLGRRAFVGLVP